jgi:hypothetical protein
VVDRSGDERRSTSVTLVDANESSELPDQSSKCYGNEESVCLKVHVHTQLGSWSGPKTERRSRAVSKRTGPQRFEFCLRSECCRGVWSVVYPLSFGDNSMCTKKPIKLCNYYGHYVHKCRVIYHNITNNKIVLVYNGSIILGDKLFWK